ncbi:MAG: hypothetical protein EA378_02705 [Phycisphaerales bacterium]|nr:MAG: hypothetical protein EA378_02705 [Phycisphaerales bacterium]
MLILLVWCLAGCAAPGPAPRGFTSFVPTEPRVDAVGGSVLVVPVRVEGLPTDRAPLARLDDGRLLPSGFWWVSTPPSPPDAPGWLTPTPPRRVLGFAEAGAGVGAGVWVATVELPLDGIGQGLWLGRSRVPMHWLPDPRLVLREVAAESATSETPWAPPAPEHVRTDPSVRSIASSLSGDPLRRWRYRLLADGLAPEDEPYRPGLLGLLEDEGGLGDAVLEATARQTEARWRVGLAWLWREDPALAQRLKRRLVAVASFPRDGRVGEDPVLAPVWPSEDAALEELLRTLLDPTLAAGRRPERVRAYLDSQPERVAWVLERHGPPGPGGTPAVTVALANLTSTGTLGWLSADGSGAAPELTPVPAMSSVVLAIEPPGPATWRAGVGPVRLSAHAGQWVRELAVAPGARPITPPGLGMGPLERAWTLRAWQRTSATQDAATEPAWATAALLMRTDHRPPAPEDAPGAERESGAGETWTLYLECRWDPMPEGAAMASERVTLRVGPWGGSRWVRVSPDGVGVDDRGRGVPVRVSIEDDRWRAWVGVPEGWLPEDAPALLSLERTDARGVRTSWPERMLPWDEKPARAAVDLRTWDPISGR